MTEQEETRLDREYSASAEVFNRIIKQYGLTEAQKALLKTLYKAEAEDGYVPYQRFVRR